MSQLWKTCTCNLSTISRDLRFFWETSFKSNSRRFLIHWILVVEMLSIIYRIVWHRYQFKNYLASNKDEIIKKDSLINMEMLILCFLMLFRVISIFPIYPNALSFLSFLPWSFRDPVLNPEFCSAWYFSLRRMFMVGSFEVVCLFKVVWNGPTFIWEH